VAPSVVFTAQTDPNNLLGRPTVTSASPPSSMLGSLPTAWLPSRAALRQAARSRSSASALANEYSYLDGPVLVRVSGRLTPPQAAKYEAAVRQ
jgi:hypothetical protein